MEGNGLSKYFALEVWGREEGRMGGGGWGVHWGSPKSQQVKLGMEMGKDASLKLTDFPLQGLLILKSLLYFSFVCTSHK